ncbi:MAG TPA: hypothetical protein VGE31_01365 [Candidatus Paceibacterota bacterium]
MNSSFFSNKNNVLYVIIGAVLILALVAGYFWYRYSTDENRMITTDTERVINEEHSLSFSYPVGDESLTLIEPPVEGQDFKKAYLLIPSEEYAAFQQNTEGGEAPAAISVFIFDLPPAASSTPVVVTSTASGTGSTTDPSSRRSRLEAWAKENNALTSFNLAKAAPEEIEVDGVDMLRYKADGLYQQDIYLGSYRGNVYLFIAQFNADTDLTYRALQQMIASVSFD